ncbi:MAG: hypothetical protein IKA64_05260 [Clostridia bacterium]|nr:hypothetical protein [Clostridia bacterium]
MVRGYQRRVVFLKNTGSTLFDEAYFLMSDTEACSGVTDAEMVKEANRIIEQNLTRDGYSDSGARRALKFILRQLPAFLAGAVFSAAVLFLIFL